MIALALFILQLFATFAYADTAVLHPLDPLSQSEINTSVAVLKAAGHVDDKTRFVFLTLREPNKPAVLKWRPGTPVTREAFVIIAFRRGAAARVFGRSPLPALLFVLSSQAPRPSFGGNDPPLPASARSLPGQHDQGRRAPKTCSMRRSGSTRQQDTRPGSGGSPILHLSP